ncbi:sperm acrosome-associated protein 5-like [Latimeria chalumnae]|uniref:sperm acrosome-associated protein 5-like n=1 Tax=Latimeria chalumnae TaxID=7897 RepID=UPI00313E1EE2
MALSQEKTPTTGSDDVIGESETAVQEEQEKEITQSWGEIVENQQTDGNKPNEEKKSKAGKGDCETACMENSTDCQPQAGDFWMMTSLMTLCAPGGSFKNPMAWMHEFTDEDITDDLQCAKRIVQDPKGLGAWNGWKDNCKGKDVSEFVEGCGV